MSHRYGENDLAFHRVRIAAFTTTIRALRGTFHQFREVCGFNALTCYVLRFVELTATLVPDYALHLCGIY